MELTARTKLSLTIPPPFDFALTVKKPAGWSWSTPKETFEDGMLATGVRFGDDPVGLIMREKDGRVRVDAYTASPLTPPARGDLEDFLLQGLGADEDLAGFYAFAQDDPVLRQAAADLTGMRIGQLDDAFAGVILAILLQMAPIARSEKMMDDVLEQFGTRIAFGGNQLIIWPKAGEIAATGPEALRKKAKLGYRADRLVKAAQYLEEHPVSLRNLVAVPEEEAIKTIMAIPGIGRYSAAIIFGQATPPIDAWSVVIMSELYAGRTPENSRKEIDRVQKELIARWGRWSYLAFAYIVNDLDRIRKNHPLTRTR